VTWELYSMQGSGYELRNAGISVAADVEITANVELAWPNPPIRDVAAGSSVVFVYDSRLSDPSPVLSVSWSVPGADGRQRWQRPLPQ
jgi:hypothetical protein